MSTRFLGNIIRPPLSQYAVIEGAHLRRAHGLTLNVPNSIIKVLHTKLKDIAIPRIQPLKELVSLYSEGEEPELLVSIQDELMTVYETLCLDLQQSDNIDSRRLQNKFERVQQELFSKNFHIYNGDNILLTVKGGVGGEEANRFAAELFNTYKYVSHDKGYGFEVVDNGVARVTGGTEFFKYEFGVHRVQRIPTNCRKVQTSTAVVTIVPHTKIDNVMLKPSELTIETMRSRGPGGQSVNKSETAVRITHIPTGISVKVQNTSSQTLNIAQAMKLLAKRIVHEQSEQFEQSKMRTMLSQYKTGDRSERIRTFQFVHDTVTDHRCNVTVLGVESFLQDGRSIERIHHALKAIDDSKIVDFVVKNFGEIAQYLSQGYQ